MILKKTISYRLINATEFSFYLNFINEISTMFTHWHIIEITLQIEPITQSIILLYLTFLFALNFLHWISFDFFRVSHSSFDWYDLILPFMVFLFAIISVHIREKKYCHPFLCGKVATRRNWLVSERLYINMDWKKETKKHTPHRIKNWRV